MLLIWVKTLVGFLLMLNFSLPLAAILGAGQMPDEPMLQLVLNMTITDYVFGALIFIIGCMDLLYDVQTPETLCVGLQYTGLGSALTMKASDLLLALDQYVGVVHCLRHPVIMHAWILPMVVASWMPIPLLWLSGLVANYLGLETREEFNQREFGIAAVDECRFSVVAEVVINSFEMGMVLLSSFCAALFIYTAVQGLKRERMLVARGEMDQAGVFFLKLKSFKRIVRVMLSLLVLDLVGSAVRISSRWLSMQVVLQVLHLARMMSFVIEGWTYGLHYPVIRNTVWSLFGRRGRRVAPWPAAEEPVSPPVP